ncbi:MAG: hypothetical protein LUF90_04665 [Rikenellaceae bacterium]|nr:hypothetical protein [Rikenellaceae bacterium]
MGLFITSCTPNTTVLKHPYAGFKYITKIRAKDEYIPNQLTAPMDNGEIV